MTAQPAGVLFGSIPLETDRDVARARKSVSNAMDTLGSRASRKTRFVTAVSEIARNAVMHGGGGTLTVYVDSAKPRVMIVCTDRGPGIANVDRAMEDGYSTAGSMGRGLGGARRLVESFSLDSVAGQGTTVTMVGIP
ncbi:ATP-binding protein [Acuticoccus sp. MNP-M23]|uniref:ATP-binding protein n=1 Tax=Acuticoccus sp. MNP-M23 TaxID=3072793 RepID=UPI0028149856|nr:ATP-binding protein [Acuticoccus sp. MNP-M23]WMS43084.1 ATP-binding protein [Acuticoccus sp. MNP-M23]